MPPQMTVHNLRRSARVPLKVIIAIEGGAETRTCEGETIVVNIEQPATATPTRFALVQSCWKVPR